MKKRKKTRNRKIQCMENYKQESGRQKHQKSIEKEKNKRNTFILLVLPSLIGPLLFSSIEESDCTCELIIIEI